MDAPEQNTPGRNDARDRIARSTTLGGLHALRNALQVVRSYTLMDMPEGPGRDGTQSGVERILEVTAALEGLLGMAPDPPTPPELDASLRLLPELFVYELRSSGLRLAVGTVAKPAPGLLHWDLPLLVCRLLQRLLDGCTPGMGGRLELSLEADRFTLGWRPDEGTLPFPLVDDRWPPDVAALVAGLGVNLQLLPERYGFVATLEEGRERSP